MKLSSDDTFLVLQSSTDNCALGGTPNPAKLWPSQQALAAKLGMDAAKFMVSLEQEVDLEAYPLPSERSDEGDALIRARAEALARTQVCAIGNLRKLSGKYLSSFFIINAFLAELTLQQALTLSAMDDVRLLELAEDEDATLP